MRNLQRYTGDIQRFRAKYRLEEGKPVWGVMAHINWDSVSDYSPMAYGSFDEWMMDTVDQVSRIPDVQWLIKVHPAEVDYDPRNGVQRFVEERFPSLAPNIRIIPAGEEISPLEFFDVVDGGVTVYGTSGLELALAGKPVILAGEAHYGGRGFTEDGLTVESYRASLHGQPRQVPSACAKPSWPGGTPIRFSSNARFRCPSCATRHHHGGRCSMRNGSS